MQNSMRWMRSSYFYLAFILLLIYSVAAECATDDWSRH